MLGLRDHRTTRSVARPTPFLIRWPATSCISSNSIRRSVSAISADGQRKFGYQTNHHTIKHFLDVHPIPVQLPLKSTTFHQFDDAYRARWTVVRMSYEGSRSLALRGASSSPASTSTTFWRRSSAMALLAWKINARAHRIIPPTN